MCQECSSECSSPVQVRLAQVMLSQLRGVDDSSHGDVRLTMRPDKARERDLREFHPSLRKLRAFLLTESRGAESVGFGAGLLQYLFSPSL